MAKRLVEVIMEVEFKVEMDVDEDGNVSGVEILNKYSPTFPPEVDVQEVDLSSVEIWE